MSTQINPTANNFFITHPLLFVDSTGTGPNEATTDGAAASGVTNRILVPVDCSMSFFVIVNCKKSGAADAKTMIREFTISNTGGTTALQGTVSTVGTDTGTAALATAGVVITADNTNDAINVNVAGVAATNLRWTVSLMSTCSKYA